MMDKDTVNRLKDLAGLTDTQLNDIISRLENMCIHLASWMAFDAGTRFGRVHADDSADDVWEGIDRMAKVHSVTGIAPALVWGNHGHHKDAAKIIDEVEKRGLHIETIHASFDGESLRYGGATNVNALERRKAVGEIMDCIALMKGTGARYLSLWFPDGTNYPGQGNFTKRYEWLLECLKEGYAAMDDDMIMLLEYKFFEPALYQTDIPDWGTAVALCNALGEKAKVIVNLGHHRQEIVMKDLSPENVMYLEPWLIMQLNPGGKVIVPHTGDFEFDNYYEPVDDKILRIYDRYSTLEGSGKRKYKVGFKSSKTTGRSAYVIKLDDERYAMVVKSFYNDPSTPYCMEGWKQPGIRGCSLYIYNDSGDSEQFGGFLEYEHCGLTMGVDSGRDQSISEACHYFFIGNQDQLIPIANALIGVESVF